LTAKTLIAEAENVAAPSNTVAAMDGVAHLNVEIVSLSRSHPQLTRAARVWIRPARGSVLLPQPDSVISGHFQQIATDYLFDQILKE